MSSALDLLRGGDPESALQTLQEDVRAEPAVAKHRIFLFQLLAYLGQWERALTQLNVAGEIDAGALGMVEVYRTALASEALRTDVFAGKRSPLVFGDPARWIAMMIESLRVGAGQHTPEAAEHRRLAFESAPTTRGRINGKPFEWIADADMRLGPILEVIMNGQYYWVPFNRIAEVRIEEPEDLRDLIWLPAEFRWANGGEAVGLIPVRYSGSERSDDAMVRFGRKTDWIDMGDECYFGAGQRELSTSEDDYPLLEVRNIVLDPGTDESPAN